MATPKEKAPKTRCSGTMTESSFWAFIRAALRSKSLRWIPRSEAIKAASRPYKGSNKRQKTEVQCAECKGWFALKNIAVDHIEDCGSLTCKEDLPEFVERMFCEKEHLQVLCKECHDTKTYMARYNVSKEEAVLRKKIVAFNKLTVAQQTEILHNALIPPAKTKAGREQQYEQFLKEQQND